MSFDIDQYKSQCSTIAMASKAWMAGRISDADYDAVLAEAKMVPARAVDKIFSEIVLRGSNWRPIDAYQF